MKITSIETFLVPPRWLFCKVSTDEGVVGWGEPVVEGSAETVRAAVDQFAEYLVGQDPLRIEDHWQTLTRGTFYRGGPVFSSAVAGIDQALWDIAGKTYGVPVHALLGGAVRDRLRAYTWVGGDDPSEVAEGIAARIEQGYGAVKMNATGRLEAMPTVAALDAVVERVASAREVLGPGRDLALDFHGRVSAIAAPKLLNRLEPFSPLFVEELVVPEWSHRFGDLARNSPIPLAAGERLYSRTEFLPLLQGGLAVAQPDLSHAGGISEVRRIAVVCEPFGALLAPHCPLGPIALAACLQVDFVTSNFLIQESSLGIHYNADADLLDYLVDTSVFDLHEGHFTLPTAPGLGIEVDEDAVREASRREHRWRSPVWRHPDGSFAEW